LNYIQRWIKRWYTVRTNEMVCAFDRFRMRLCNCSVPASAKIFGRPRFSKHEGRVILGERVVVNSLSGFGRLGLRSPCIFSTGRTGIIEIGDDSGINGTAIYAADRVSIGKRVLIADGVRITDRQSHPIDAIPRRYAPETDPPRPVVIEDDVWIGMDVLIMPGVRIGRGSVIGAKALVTKDIPPLVVAAGIPAKVLRSLRIAP
jgi:acetyltransferase-like isoleucine patch superfamily enzyme